ncbi:MAG: lysophospholipid acyltransferase family protein [Puniceicoccaceae bacterium]
MNSLPTFSEPHFADYTSPEVKPGPLSRLLPSALFYFRVSQAVFASAYKAKRGKFSDWAWYSASLKVRKAFEKTGAHVSVKGTANIANLDEPCVFIGNHMSTAETFLMASMVLPFRPVTFVVKEALVQYPVFKHIMLSRSPIVVGRVNPREDLKAVLQGGRERLEAGTSIVIFPQKTRTVEFDRESFNTIGVKLAKRAGVPVIPLALKTNAWSNGKLFKDYGPFLPHEAVHFAFGEPIRIEGSDREAHEAVIQFIESHLREWGIMK